MKTHHSSNRFLQFHPSMNHPDFTCELLKSLKKLNISHFGHVHLDRRYGISSYNTNPEFVRRYYSKGHFKKGIHTVKPSQSTQYYLWDELLKSNHIPAVYQDLMQLGKGHLFTICHSTNHVTECFHFAVDLGQDEKNLWYIRNIDRLENFIQYYKNQVSAHKSLFTSIYECKLWFRSEGANYFDDLILPDQMSFSDEKTNNKRIYPLGRPSAYVTPRQIECLHQLAQGQSYLQIANELKISERTVREHIQVMKEKLNCKSLFQLGQIYNQISNTPN